MVFFNYALRKLNAKIVYYGPGLCGKTTNLQWIHDHFEGGQRGKMLSLATEGDRTIFFDLLPLEIGTIRGMQVTLQLYTVPGQVHYNSTRQLVLRGADGVVFVADSQRTMTRSNVESAKNLEENLLLQGVELKAFPCVLQFNKRDLRDIMGVDEMDQMLNRFSVPIFEAIATNGVGVQDTLEGIVKLVMRSLRERYEPVAAAGPRPVDLPSAPSRPVVRPPTLRVPSAPAPGPAPVLAAPPGGPAGGEAHEPGAVTADLHTATRPPGLGEPSADLAPPSGEGLGLASGGEPQSLDDIPTAVFEAPELLEEPLLEPEPTFLDVPVEELHDEVTATVLDADEEVFLPAEEGVDAGVQGEGEGVPQVELDVEEEEPGDLLWGDVGGDQPDEAAEDQAAEPASDEVFGPRPELVVPDEGEEAGIALGEVVLDRDRGELEPYEDLVRAPGPFAVAPLDRGEAEDALAPEAEGQETEPPSIGHLPPEQAPWGRDGSPFGPEAAEGPAVGLGASPFEETEGEAPAAETDASPFGELPAEEPVGEAEVSPYEELDTAPLAEKPSPLGDEPTPTPLVGETERLESLEPKPEERRPGSWPESPAPAQRGLEPTQAAGASVDDLMASVMPGRVRRGAPPQAPAESQAPPLPAAVPPPAPRQPVLLDDGDPFAFDEEPRLVDERTPTAVEMAAVVPSVELAPRPSEIQVRAGENQLRVQLEGRGAIAEYGEVREMDIVVPVPGPWIGNRRVTLQLRLTLTPAAEDGDDGSGGPS